MIRNIPGRSHWWFETHPNKVWMHLIDWGMMRFQKRDQRQQREESTHRCGWGGPGCPTWCFHCVCLWSAAGRAAGCKLPCCGWSCIAPGVWKDGWKFEPRQKRFKAFVLLAWHLPSGKLTWIHLRTGSWNSRTCRSLSAAPAGRETCSLGCTRSLHTAETRGQFDQL